jgi:hypothetical protein
MAMVAIAIAAVASQPRTFQWRGNTRSLMV